MVLQASREGCEDPVSVFLSPKLASHIAMVLQASREGCEEPALVFLFS